MARLTKLPKMKDQYLEAQVLNMLTYQDFFDRLSRIAMSIFEWENLPDSMDSDFLERCLFLYGNAALLYTQEYGFINTQAATHGKLNIYYKPTSLECYGPDSLNIIRTVYNGLDAPRAKDEECILVENMRWMVPTVSKIDLFAMRLAEAQRSEDTNIKQQKFLNYVQADQKQLQTIRTAYEQYTANTPIIIADKNGLEADAFKPFKTETPFVADKIMEYRYKIFNEALSYLGIANINEKKERQLTDEVAKNNEEVNVNLQVFLVPRQRAARQFNQKYGFAGTDKEISVKIRSDLHNVIKQEMSVVKDLVSNPAEDIE